MPKPTPKKKLPSAAPGNAGKKKKSTTSKRPQIQKLQSDDSRRRSGPFLNTPIHDLLQVFGKAPDQWAARYVIVITAIILRSAVGLGSFSGQGQGPINGDFEAQRHWMELTINLPIKEWYFYDLPYWGLDYPPLTAFHSWFCGKLGNLINDEWFAFVASRGLESPGLKTFMRFTSLISELVIYVPALVLFISLMSKKLNLTRMDQIVITTVILTQPSLMLIDHGHFQYNSVMLGLFIFSLVDLLEDNLGLASIWFMSSILFKQMALYYSTFVFFFILSRLFTPLPFNLKFKKKVASLVLSFNFTRLFVVGITVIITTFVIITPFIIGSSNTGEQGEVLTVLKQILIRMFPFQRGLFEDKVANFWCTTNILVKYKNVFSADQLRHLSLILTLLSILPSGLMVFFKNIWRHSTPPQLLIYGSAATAWGFYLFSFQVHEKTVLVPLIPSTLLLVTNDRDIISIVQWINNIAVFSMYPLLKRDNLILQYIVTVLLSNWLIGGFNLSLLDNLLWPTKKAVWLWKPIILLSYLAALSFHFVDFFWAPPANLPDLFVILNTTIAFGCFAIFYIWLNYSILKL